MKAALIRVPAGLLVNKIVKFLFVGAVNSIFSFSVYSGMIFLGTHYSIAVLVANVLGVLFNYQTIGRLVFGNKGSHALVKFILTSLVTYALALLIIGRLLMFGFNRYVAGALAAIPVAALSFILMDKIVFKKPRRAEA